MAYFFLLMYMDVNSDNLPIEGDILVIYANNVVKLHCDGKMFSCISLIFGSLQTVLPLQLQSSYLLAPLVSHVFPLNLSLW